MFVCVAHLSPFQRPHCAFHTYRSVCISPPIRLTRFPEPCRTVANVKVQLVRDPTNVSLHFKTPIGRGGHVHQKVEKRSTSNYGSGSDGWAWWCGVLNQYPRCVRRDSKGGSRCGCGISPYSSKCVSRNVHHHHMRAKPQPVAGPCNEAGMRRFHHSCKLDSFNAHKCFC